MLLYQRSYLYYVFHFQNGLENGLYHDDCHLCGLHRIRYVHLFLLRYDHHVFFLYLRSTICVLMISITTVYIMMVCSVTIVISAICIESVTCVSSFYITIIMSSFCIFESTICVLMIRITTVYIMMVCSVTVVISAICIESVTCVSSFYITIMSIFYNVMMFTIVII